MKIEGSSHVTHAEYDPAEKTLVVGFKSGSATKYLNVPAEKWTGFQASESKGKFLHAEVIAKHRAFPAPNHKWSD